jgi:aldehyde dehydrogenase (NAD+)
MSQSNPQPAPPNPTSILIDLGLNLRNSGCCGDTWIAHPAGGELACVSPATEENVALVLEGSREDYEKVVEAAQRQFRSWRMTPAPRRGAVVRRLGEELRKHKAALGRLIALEVGKILSEAEGEVQEAIDMADFAVGLSRQLYGLSMHSERPRHRMYEQWHPLGPIGIITAFNFPIAVWAWNAMIAAVCGDTMIWKPSRKAPLTAIAVQHICNRVMAEQGVEGVFCLAIGADDTIGEALISDERLPLISATGSSRMGRHVGQAVARRLGRSLLELGGNNAVIVMDDADLHLALRAVVFGAAGTAGQRCTTTRRLFLHRKIAGEFMARLVRAYQSISIGDPLEAQTLMGPLIDAAAVDAMKAALKKAVAQGGELLTGGRRPNRKGYFVEPAIVKARPEMEIVQEETFAPILYVMEFDDLNEVIRWHNGVRQGLSSALFTSRLQHAERFLSVEGSDCGIANINIGTSGAEIGGAFGGEKETGGGREAGSDAWKAYMRRQTTTINWGDDLPLAQGVKFDVGE